MRALLQKDFYLIKLNLKSLILLTVIFFGVDYLSYMNSGFNSNLSFSQMIPVIFAMQIQTTLGFDEQSGFANFALSLPLNKKTYLRSKYVVALLLTFTAYLLTLVFGAFSSITQGRNFFEYTVSSATATCMGIILLSITLPLVFKFGSEGSRLWIFLLLMILMSILAAIIGTVKFEAPILTGGTMVMIMSIIFVTLLVILFTSYRLSLKFFHFK